MTSTLTLALAATLSLCAATLVQASHANPWATADDVVLEQYHDDNQTRSIDTPGEDEMRGVMVRKAFGKTSGIASDTSGNGDKTGTGAGPSDSRGTGGCCGKR